MAADDDQRFCPGIDPPVYEYYLLSVSSPSPVFPVFVIDDLRRRGTSDTLTRGERSNRGELSMLMTRFKEVADFLDIVARGKFRGNLAKRMGIEISANLKVSSGISQTIDRTIFRNSFGVIYK